MHRRTSSVDTKATLISGKLLPWEVLLSYSQGSPLICPTLLTPPTVFCWHIFPRHCCSAAGFCGDAVDVVLITLLVH